MKFPVVAFSGLVCCALGAVIHDGNAFFRDPNGTVVVASVKDTPFDRQIVHDLMKRDAGSECFSVDTGSPSNMHWNDVDQFVVVDGKKCKPKLELRDGSCSHHMDLGTRCSAFCQISAFYFYAKPIHLMDGQMCRYGENCKMTREVSHRVEISNTEVERHVFDAAFSLNPTVTWGFGFTSTNIGGSGSARAQRDNSNGGHYSSGHHHRHRHDRYQSYDPLNPYGVTAEEALSVEEMEALRRIPMRELDPMPIEEDTYNVTDEQYGMQGGPSRKNKGKGKKKYMKNHAPSNVPAEHDPEDENRPYYTFESDVGDENEYGDGEYEEEEYEDGDEEAEYGDYNPEQYDSANIAAVASNSSSSTAHPLSKRGFFSGLMDIMRGRRPQHRPKAPRQEDSRRSRWGRMFGSAGRGLSKAAKKLTIPLPTITSPQATVAMSFSAHWTNDWTRTYHHSVERASFTSITHKQIPGDGCGAFWAVPVAVAYCGWMALPQFPNHLQEPALNWLRTTDNTYNGLLRLGSFPPPDDSTGRGKATYPPPMWNITAGRCPVNHVEFPYCHAGALYIPEIDGGDGAGQALQRTVWRPYDCDTGSLLPSHEQPREVRQQLDFDEFFKYHIKNDERLFNPNLQWRKSKAQKEDEDQDENEE